MPKCPKCASAMLLDHLRVLTGGESLQHLTVQAYGNPDALVFKERANSKMEATVCGECGYTELYAVDPKSLAKAVAEAGRKSRRK